MYKGERPKVFPIIVTILVISLVVAAVASVIRMVATRQESNNTNTQQSTESFYDQVVAHNATNSVRWTVRGPIVADETFRSYQIEISPNKRTYTVYQGYLDKQLDRKEFENNQQAYEQLVYALSKAQIQDTRTVDDDDVRGVCATGGRLYTFETMDSGTTKTRIWTSSCQGSPGSMKADVAKIHALFANQIPGFAPMFDKTQ